MKEQRGKKLPKQEAGRNYDAREAFSGFLRMLSDDRESMLRFLDGFPMPVEVFDPSGTAVFVNRACMEQHHIKNPDLIVGKYNLLLDPVCNDQMGLKDFIRRAFRGEGGVACDIIPPIQDLVDRKVIDEKPFEMAYSDFYLYPVMEEGKLAFVVFINVFKKIYEGKPEIARAKDYIEKHWQGEYDGNAVSEYAGLAERQLQIFFKQYTGIAPKEYHRKCKIEHLKEKLADRGINIKQAFLACGEDSRGRIARGFRKMTGLSPKEYRNSLK